VKQNELSPASGSKKARKRVGRGNGSGHGTYSGRGLKGQKARAGGKMRPGFEGGQLPLIKRLPKKRGFYNRFRTEYEVVSLSMLNTFEAGSEITVDILNKNGFLRSMDKPVKVLANGEVDRALNIKLNKYSAAAKSKIEAAGGTAEEVDYDSTEVN
jgi:large subunit ribosomal protein L15